MKIKKIRFCPLVRVSTTQQAKKGESLPVQKKKITQYVKSLGGTLIDDPWRYSGAEHAATDSQRANLDNLLTDSAKGLFDAVIIRDISRWSRDTLKSEQAIRILKKNGIRFFEGTKEYNLFDETEKYMVTQYTIIHEMVAMQNARKSIESKISKAEKNIPCCGKLPFGRTYDKSTGWGLDKTKHAMVEDVAEKYLNGTHTMIALAKTYGMVSSSLWRILHTRSGDTWEVSFKSERLNINETIKYKVPRLLSDATIKAIKERASSNRTCVHGYSKHPYLLFRMIFCKKCGRLLHGQTQKEKHRYYRHKNKTDCNSFSYIHADRIEADILMHIFYLVGDETGFKRAIRAAIPNTAQLEKDSNRIQRIIFELKKITTKKNRLVDAVMNATLDNDTVKKRMDKLKDQESLLNGEKSSLISVLKNQPSQIEIENRFKGWQRYLSDRYKLDHEHLLEMNFNQRRELLEHFFSGKDQTGKRCGVDIKNTGPDEPIYYQIRGNLPALNDAGQVGQFPFGFEYDDERKAFEDIRDRCISGIAQVNHRNIYPCHEQRYQQDRLAAGYFIIRWK